MEIEILFSTPTHACTFFAYELNIHRVYIGPWELTTTDHMHASSRVQNRDLHYGQIWPQNMVWREYIQLSHILLELRGSL